jgi:hypothetical protein
VIVKEQEKRKGSTQARKKVRREIDWSEWDDLQKEEREFKKSRKQKHKN